ncbi:hypothetical protein AALA79_14145 [Lachnospiraceae bacterium 64-25]|nr:hypothetical protein IMSAGC005_03691 [Lachnospiraceae bacterium]
MFKKTIRNERGDMSFFTIFAKNSVNPLKNVTPPENANADLANLIAALEQSPELVSMLTKALKQNAISS